MAEGRRQAPTRRAPRRAAGGDRRLRYARTHVRVRVWMLKADWERLERRCREQGLTLADWVRDALARDEGLRPPEAEQKVRMVIPEWLAQIGEQVMAERGQDLLRLAAQHRHDPLLAHGYRRAARPYLDAEGWFHEVLRRYQLTRAAAPPPTSD